MIVTVSQVSAVHSVVVLYEVRVTNSLPSNFNFGIGLQCRVLPDLREIWGSLLGPTHQGSPGCTL